MNMARALGGAEDATNSVSVQTNTAVFGPVIPVVTGIALRSDQLVYDSVSNRLYAAVSRWNGEFENGVRAVDMGSGLIGPLVALGTKPLELAAAGNGQYLYVAVSNANQVFRLNLQSSTIDLMFRVIDQFGQQHSVVDMKVLPNQPNAVAIARAGPQNDVAIYQNGVQSRRSPVDLFCSHIEFSTDTPSLLYGVTFAPNITPQTIFYRMSIGASSITLLDATSGLFSGYVRRVEHSRASA